MNWEQWRGVLITLAIIVGVCLVTYWSPHLSTDVYHTSMVVLSGMGGANLVSSKSRAMFDGSGGSGGVSIRPPKMPPEPPTTTKKIGVALAAIAIVRLLTACGAQQAQTEKARADYQAELVSCAKDPDAGSRAAIDACRAAVDRKWGVDAGVEGAK